MVETSRVVVVGGGQAGLAMSRELLVRGVDHVVLEAAATPGSAWERRWTSMRLFTPARYSALPGLPFPADPDSHPTAAEVAGYLQAYAAHHDLPLRLSRRVDSLEAGPAGGFLLRTPAGTYAADQVVVATGPFQRPRRPPCADDLTRTVRQIHSSEYLDPGSLGEGDVLVVGAGNSGLQIAEELARTRPTRISVGGRLPALPARLLGRSVFEWLDRSGAMDIPATSPVGRRMKGRELLVGGSLRRRVRAAGIETVGRVVGCRNEAILTEDLQVLRPANVVWATGFEPDFGWIRLPVLDHRGHPVHHRGVTSVPGLYFLGLSWLHTRGSALIGWVGRDAAHLARHIDAGIPASTLPTGAPS